MLNYQGLNYPGMQMPQVNPLLQQYQQAVLADLRDDGVINGSIFNNMQGGGLPQLPPQMPPQFGGPQFGGGGFPGMGMPQMPPQFGGPQFGGGFPGMGMPQMPPQFGGPQFGGFPGFGQPQLPGLFPIYPQQPPQYGGGIQDLLSRLLSLLMQQQGGHCGPQPPVRKSEIDQKGDGVYNYDLGSSGDNKIKQGGTNNTNVVYSLNGNDTLTQDGSKNRNYANLAGGNNTATLSGSENKNIVVAGNGNNTVSTNGSKNTDTIRLGSGADNVTLRSTDSTSNVSTGAGNDEVRVATDKGTVTVNAGTGQDRVTIDGAKDTKATVNLGKDGERDELRVAAKGKNDVTVTGDDKDIVRLEGKATDWTKTTVDGKTVYTHNAEGTKVTLGDGIVDTNVKFGAAVGEHSQVVGDPHFIIDGHMYDVQGENGKTYNIIKDGDLQVNSRFGSWGGTATVQKEIGVKVGNQKLNLNAETGKAQINGADMEVNKSYDIGNGQTAVWNGSTLQVNTEEYTMQFVSRGTYIDSYVDVTSKGAEWNGVLAHGLLGQNIRDGQTVVSATDQQGTGAIAGNYRQYEAADVFADWTNPFNR